MLAEQVALNEDGLVHDSRSPDLRRGRVPAVRGGDRVECAVSRRASREGRRHRLVLGTGGVSIAALQLARAGARVIATSSSDEKACARQGPGRV